MKITDCRFCGEFDKRVINEGDGNILFIVSGDKEAGEIERLASTYSEATFAWRYACVDAPDVALAMSGCFVLLRFLIAKARLVFVPLEYAKEFFGSTANKEGEFIFGEKTVFVYETLSSRMYEVYSLKTGPILS